MSGETNAGLVERDRFRLTKAQMLEDYAAISRKRRGAAAACSTRHQSRQYFDILATQATGAGIDWQTLRASLTRELDEGTYTEPLDALAQAEIGRILLLSPSEEGDLELGVFILENTTRVMPANARSRRFRLLLVQHYILAERYESATAALSAWKDIRRTEDEYLVSELNNPFRNAGTGDHDVWLTKFNQSLVAHDIAPLFLKDIDAAPFDRVSANARVRHDSLKEELPSTPSVSVVMTAYKPAMTELITSVGSILRQTIEPIEVIIVDDASGAEYLPVFAAVERLDSRVRVISLQKNSGTYAARNVGYGASVGEFITGQDDDDWSHPERLEKQVAFMRENPDTAGCRVSGIMCGPDLSRLRLGYKSINSNASSLMIRREQFERAGGFIEMRKAADTEFMHRLERLCNSTVSDLPQPLSLVRILPDSLSRSEFQAGWSHPARRQIKSSYNHWHANSDKSSLEMSDGTSAPVYIPRRFRVAPPTDVESFDVVIAGDWRQFGGPQKSMIEEIRALKSRGYRVAVLQLEAPRFMSTAVKPLTPHVQELINDGTVEEILYDDEVHTSVLLLRYPPILQFVPDVASSISVDQMYIVANQAPSELDGSDIRYLVRDCHENAISIFTPNVTWVPQGPQVRDAIRPYLTDDEIEEFDFPGIVDPSDWATAVPRRPRSGLPVVGRHSRDNSMKWPEDGDVLEQVYPMTGIFDVRMMGGSSVPERVLGRDTPPPSWIVYATDALPVRSFLHSLDFYVFYQNTVAVEAFGRAILEAIASNLVVILPPHYAPVFKEAALYARPEDVIGIVQRYHQDRSLYVDQQERALRVLRRDFTHDAFVNRIATTIDMLRAGR